MRPQPKEGLIVFVSQVWALGIRLRVGWHGKDQVVRDAEEPTTRYFCKNKKVRGMTTCWKEDIPCSRSLINERADICTVTVELAR